MRKRKKFIFLLLPFIMAIHDFAKIFMHINVKKFSLASYHRHNAKLERSFIVFTIDEDV